MEDYSFGKFLKRRYRYCSVALQVLIGAGFLAVLGKAFCLQILEHDIWMERVRAQTETTLKVPCYRGSISDRKDRLLAYSVAEHSLFADGGTVRDPAEASRRLASILDEPRGVLKEKMSQRDRPFIWLKRHLSDYQAEAVRRLGIRGLHLTEEYQRFYPYRQLAGQTIGFVGLDGKGLEGIEKTHDALLRQNFLTMGHLRDGSRKSLWLNRSLPLQPDERLGLRLTIDSYIQYICEQELEKVIREYNARSGEIVVIDPRTFEILAMANWPPFDPNLYQRESPDHWRNRAVTDSFEPGSTFKVFLLASALNERTVKNTDYIYCENGHFGVTTRVIHDTHPHKSLSVSEILKYSSNIGAAKIALKMGGETFYDYIRAFGFGRQTGLDVPGETSGILRHWKRWYPIDLAVTGFGQSIGVTALQLTAGIACIANDGLYARPFVVRGIVDNEGRTVKGFGPGPFRRVVDKEVARQVREMMVEVAREGGTGVRAALKDYTVAGKTGTAQVLDPQTGGYSSHKYNSLFTGFVPAEDPRLVISVVVHEPKGENYGGVVAGPVFREIASKVLPYLGVTPSYEPDRVPVKVPWVKVAAVEAAKASGDSSGGYASEASRCNGVFMPDVKGMSLKLALQRIPSDGVRVDLEGKGKVVSQDPAPGTVLKKGMLVKLTLHD